MLPLLPRSCIYSLTIFRPLPLCCRSRAILSTPLDELEYACCCSNASRCPSRTAELLYFSVCILPSGPMREETTIDDDDENTGPAVGTVRKKTFLGGSAQHDPTTNKKVLEVVRAL